MPLGFEGAIRIVGLFAYVGVKMVDLDPDRIVHSRRKRPEGGKSRTH